MKHFLLVLFGSLSSILLGVLFIRSSASAASPYDNTYNTINKLYVETINPDYPSTNMKSDDLATDWSTYFKDCDIHASWNSTSCNDIKNKITFDSSDAWTVSQVSTQWYDIWYKQRIQLIYCSDVAQLQWYNYEIQGNSTTLQVDGPNASCIKLELSAEGSNYLVTETGSTGVISGNLQHIAPFTNTSVGITAYTNFLTYNFSYVYPDGYKGKLLQDTGGPTPEPTRIVIAPNFNYEYDSDSIKVTDKKNNLIPELEPEEGYTFAGYYIEWTLWKCVNGEYSNNKSICSSGDQELIDQKTRSLEEGNEWENLSHDSYRVEAQYIAEQCYRYESYPATPDYCFRVSLKTLFAKVYDFQARMVTIKLDGSSGYGETSNEGCDITGFCGKAETVGLLPCFTIDPPFIQLDGCVKNIFWLVDSLTFSKITILNISTNTIECRELSVIGEWINLPNVEVCPQFPSNVRDIITPFITFAFALMMTIFISKRIGESY